jgi:hypothetical protein
VGVHGDRGRGVWEEKSSGSEWVRSVNERCAGCGLESSQSHTWRHRKFPVRVPQGMPRSFVVQPWATRKRTAPRGPSESSITKQQAVKHKQRTVCLRKETF